MSAEASTYFIDYLSSGTALVASLVAVYGINTWRREYVGKKKMDIGHDMLEAFYQAKDAIRYIRSPFTFESERIEAIKDAPEASNEFHERAAVLSKRLNEKQKELAQFRAMKYQVMAVFGSDTGSVFDEFTTIPNQISVAMQMLVKHYWPREGKSHASEEAFDKHINDMSRFEGIIWDGREDGDEILDKLEKIQAELESIVHEQREHVCKRILKKLYAWFSECFKKE